MYLSELQELKTWRVEDQTDSQRETWQRLLLCCPIVGFECYVSQQCRTTMSVHSLFFVFFTPEINWKLVPSQTRAATRADRRAQLHPVVAAPLAFFFCYYCYLLIYQRRHLFRGNRHAIGFSFKYLNHLQVPGDIESLLHLTCVKPFSAPLALPLVHLTILFKTQYLILNKVFSALRSCSRSPER